MDVSAARYRPWALLISVAACAPVAHPARVAPDLPAVGAVLRLRGVGLCLAVRLARGTLLTAAHCVLGLRSLADLRVTRPDGRELPALACALHPTLAARFGRCEIDDPAAPGRIHDPWTDLALVRVRDDEGAPSVPPLDAVEALEGRAAWVVTDDAPRWVDAPAPRLVRNRVTRVTEGEIDTTGPEPADISTRPGDSGGPLLVWSRGAWRVAGALSGGDSSYSPDSRFAPTHLSVTAAWIRAVGEQ